MNISSIHIDLISRKQKLHEIAVLLKERFLGLDSIIDEVISLLTPWYIFPESQRRPTVINLWGLTGSGKTALVQSIVEFLDYRKFYTHMDMGEFESDSAKLKLERLRKSVDPEIQAHTAVHEAGHAVLAALTLRIIPSMVVSRTASDMEGFCIVNFPKGPMTKETLKKDIIISLGGYVAEKMIFGDEYTCSGVYDDIQEASALANKAIRKYAMGSDPIHLAVESQKENAFVHIEEYTAEAIDLIKECELEATLILQRNKLLLLKMAEYLTAHSKMEEQLIREYVEKYSTEEWINQTGFVKKENYYQFNKIVQEKLKEMHDTDVNLILEKISAAEEITSDK